MSDLPRWIADAVTGAILAQALPPGTKLGERELAQACGTSRAVVKQAMLILGETGLVETRKNRGASVARLTTQEAYDLFEALTVLEQGVAVQLMQRMAPAEWDVLQEHVDLVQTHMDENNNDAADRQGPQFHTHFISLLGSKAVSALHQQLVRRSTLLRMLYVNRRYHRCRLNDDHQVLIDLLRAKEADAVFRHIEDHYRSIVRGFDMDRPLSTDCDLAAALAPWLGSKLVSN